jgi:predicted MFS family arabinose efflux permease
VPVAGPHQAGPHEVGARHRLGGVLWQRDFRLLWIGESVSSIGNAMAVVGVPLLAVSSLHASTFAVAALTAAAYLPWLILGLPAGAWVDRWPCRPLMIICDVVSALLYASLPVAAWLDMLTTGQVVLVALAAGSANVFFATAYRVYLPSLVSAADLIEGNAKLQGSTSVAAVCGRGTAGIAAQAVGDAAALLFNAASFLVSAVCLLLIRAATPPREPARRDTVRAEVSAGIRFITRDPYLRPLTIYPAVANFAYSGSAALVVVFLVRVAEFSAAAVGVLMACAGIGGVLGAMTARRLARRLGTARALVLSTLGTGAFGLLIPLTATGPRAACYAVGSAVVAAGIIIFNTIAGSFQQTYCPPSMLGRVSASMRFLVYGSIPLGALLAGALGDALTVRAALWVTLGVYALSGTLLLTPALCRDKDLPRHMADPTVRLGAEPAVGAGVAELTARVQAAHEVSEVGQALVARAEGFRRRGEDLAPMGPGGERGQLAFGERDHGQHRGGIGDPGEVEGHAVLPVTRAEPEPVGGDHADLADEQDRGETGPDLVQGVQGGDRVLGGKQVFRLQFVAGARPELGPEVRQPVVPPAGHAELLSTRVGGQAGHRVPRGERWCRSEPGFLRDR